MRIPAMLCVDVEPDPRHIPVPSPSRWPGFEAFLAAGDRLRDRLAEPTGRPAQIGWFLRMDPQIEVAYGTPGWLADRYGDELDGLVAAGDELGLHPHSWRWEANSWISDQTPSWAAHCAQTGLVAYEAAFGSQCRSYRHGDRFTSPALQRLLQAGGVRCDLTLEPGRPEVAGLVPQEASLGTLPAVPSDLVRPFTVGSDGPEHSLLVMPLTTSLDLGREAAGGGVFGTLVLWSPPRAFASLLEARLAGEDDLTHLAFALRTEVALSPRGWEWVDRNLAHIGRELGQDIEWLTPFAGRQRLVDGAGEPAAPVRWPRSLSATDLQRVAGSAHQRLADVEEEMVERHERTKIELQQLVAERDAVAAQLSSALAAATTQGEAAQALREELEVLRATATWRLHQRLLPLLRLLRRPSSRGG